MAEPQFVEVKGFAWLGEARKRLENKNVPRIEEIKKFAKKLTGYSVKDVDERSRVVLLSKG